MTHVGNVREHNEDAHFFDADLGIFVVCDGMGGHAAGEVASAIAIKTIKEKWADAETTEIADVWLARGTAIAKKQLIQWLRDGVVAAHQAIIAEAERDSAKQGMGTTLVAAMVVGGELVFAHAGDSRAYMVRDGISMQLTEDHTLLQRLLTAGIDVDVTGDGARFRSMLTNALGIGQDCKVATFCVPLADGDRFLFCSDGISEYVPENEIGEVLVKQPSPARAAQRLVELALDRGGADNATALVVRVLEAGEDPVPAEQRRRDDLNISLCELWTEKVSPQQRLRALRIAIPRDHAPGETLPAHTLGDRVAWIIVEGEVTWEGEEYGPGAFIYPDSLIAGSPVPERDQIAVARTEVRAVAIRSDDWRELCEDDTELGEALLDSLATIIEARKEALIKAAAAREATIAMGRASTGDATDAAYAATLPPGTPAPKIPGISKLPGALTGKVTNELATATTVPPPTVKRVVVDPNRGLDDGWEGDTLLERATSPTQPPATPPVTPRTLTPVSASKPRQVQRALTEPEIEMSMELDAEPPPPTRAGTDANLEHDTETHVVDLAPEPMSATAGGRPLKRDE